MSPEIEYFQRFSKGPQQVVSSDCPSLEYRVENEKVSVAV